MSRLGTIWVTIAASVTLLITGCGEDEQTRDAGTSSSASSASATGTTETTDALESSLSVDGDPLEGTYVSICQHGQTGFTLVGLVDVTSPGAQGPIALASVNDDGTVTSVWFGEAANGEPLWQAAPSAGQGSVSGTKNGDLTFVFTGEVVNAESRREAPFTLVVACDRIEETGS